MNSQLSGLNNLVLRAFGSVNWGATDQPDQPNSFTLGQLDLFMTSTLNERVSVLAEIVLEGSINTRVVTDLERLQLTYRFNDHLNISAGRYHTGIGYYNTAFHHGAFFETPIGRPRVFAFEDEGGILPVHEVGVTVHGLVPKTGSSLHYLAEIGNGRRWDVPPSGADADEVEEPNRDKNGAKATNVGLSYRPERWRGFDVGGSFYRDTIADASDQSVQHRIGAVFATYRTASTEILAEWLWLSHTSAGRPPTERRRIRPGVEGLGQVAALLPVRLAGHRRADAVHRQHAILRHARRRPAPRSVGVDRPQDAIRTLDPRSRARHRRRAGATGVRVLANGPW